MQVLIVDDDLALADVIAFTMRRAGFEVILAYDGQMALERWESSSPDLLILDLNLPRISGFKVCQYIRARSDIPIIILSVRADEEDIINGLKYGADDYIIKPFSPRQVIARVEAVLRRSRQKKVYSGMLAADDLTLDVSRSELCLGNRAPVHLTRLECRLMEVLLRNYRQVVPTDLLIEAVWGPGQGERGMLKQLVYRLRQKLPAGYESSACLETVTGIGYCLMGVEESADQLATSMQA